MCGFEGIAAKRAPSGYNFVENHIELEPNAWNGFSVWDELSPTNNRTAMKQLAHSLGDGWVRVGYLFVRSEAVSSEEKTS
jgi:hypothetical protein